MMRYKLDIRDSNGIVASTQYAYIVHDKDGKHDANAENPTIPSGGWELAYENVIEAEEIDNGFPVLSRKQLRFALLSLDITADTVNAVIDAIQDGVEKESAKIFWEDSLTYHREHPMVAQIGGALKIVDEAIDAAWMAAAAIN